MTERETPPQSIPETVSENPENPRMREMFETNKDRLVFEELKQYAEVPEGIKVISHKEDENWYVTLITDGSTETLDSEFNNFDSYDFPEIFTSEDRFYRPLIYMSIEELTPEILYVHGLEINLKLRRKGVAQSFYERLEAIAKEKGYKFLAGFQDNEKLASVYLRMGRYFFEEIKPELQKEFKKIVKGLDVGLFDTIKFLDKSDVERYVRQECLSESIDERMDRNKIEKSDELRRMQL